MDESKVSQSLLNNNNNHHPFNRGESIVLLPVYHNEASNQTNNPTINHSIAISPHNTSQIDSPSNVSPKKHIYTVDNIDDNSTAVDTHNLTCPTVDRQTSMRKRLDSGAIKAHLNAKAVKEIEIHSALGQLQVKDDKTDESIVVFQFNIFVREFVIHLLGPIAIPFVWYFESRAAVYNRQLQKIDLNNMLWALIITANVIYYFHYPMDGVSFSEVFLGTCMFLARNCIIAFKYAFFSPALTDSRLTRLWTREEISNSLILGGWRILGPKSREIELNHAIARSRITGLEHMYLTFQTPRNENLNCTAYLTEQPEGVECSPEDEKMYRQLKYGKVHVKLLLRDMLADAVNSNQATYYPIIALALTLIHGAIPFGWRLIAGYGFIGSGGWEGFVCLSVFMVSFFNFWLNLMYVMLGIIDYNRRIFVQHQMSAMLTSKYKIWQTKKAAAMPLLDYHSPNNIAYWLDARAILKCFGLQFFQRIQAYASVWAFCLALFVSFLLFQVIYNQTTSVESVAIAFAVYDVIVLLILLIIMVFGAQQLNAIHVEHRLILTQKKNNIERILNSNVYDDKCGIIELDKTTKHKLRGAKNMLKSAIEVITIEDTTTPVKILGIDANQNLFRALLGVAASGFLAAGKILLDKQ